MSQRIHDRREEAKSRDDGLGHDDRASQDDTGRVLHGPWESPEDRKDPRRTHVPPGVYIVTFVRSATRKRYKREVWDIDFKIFEGPEGTRPCGDSCNREHDYPCRPDHAGRLLRRYATRPKDSKFSAFRSSYAKDFRRIVGLHPPGNLRAISPKEIYADCQLEAIVESVVKDDDREDLPEGAQYSVIRRIRGRVAGVPPYLRRRGGGS